MDEKESNVVILDEKSFTYIDMLNAFIAGKRHERECGDSDKDCWDFITWIKENV